MGDLFKKVQHGVDTRKRRRFFRLVGKIQRISAVVLVWMLGLAVIYGMYIVVFQHPYFQVDEIKVEGDLRALNTEQVIESSGVREGDQLLRVPVAGVQKRLMENPWVKEAAVHRKLPHMVWIYIKEYVPEAIVHSGGWRYVDGMGDVFKTLSALDKKDYPVITGLGAVPFGNDEAYREKMSQILGVKRIYERSFFGEIYGLSEIHFDENRGVSIMTQNDPMELRLGFDSYDEKLERLQVVYPAIKSHGGVISYVDFGSPGKVVVKYGT